MRPGDIDEPSPYDVLKRLTKDRDEIELLVSPENLATYVGLLQCVGFLSIDVHARSETESDWKIVAKKDNTEKLEEDDDWEVKDS